MVGEVKRIDTRNPESGIVLTYMGEIKLEAFSLGKRIGWFPFASSPCGVQGKLKFLLNFGFISHGYTHLGFGAFRRVNGLSWVQLRFHVTLGDAVTQ